MIHEWRRIFACDTDRNTIAINILKIWTVIIFCIEKRMSGFPDLASWKVLVGTENYTSQAAADPLQSRLHRLQLLRQWLLCFSRELHDHFANTVFLPYHQAVEKLFAARPPLNTIITGWWNRNIKGVVELEITICSMRSIYISCVNEGRAVY